MNKISLLLLVLFISRTVSSETIRFVSGDFCPYACDPAKENGRIGFTHEILEAIFKKHGHKVSVELLTWERAFWKFNEQNENIDGIIGVNRELPIDNALALYPEVEICQYTHAFYALKNSPLTNNWQYHGTKSLNNMMIGAVKGYSYCSSAITKYIAESSTSEIESLKGTDITQRNYLKLLDSRIDIWIANIPMTEYFLSNEKKIGSSDVDKVIKLSDLPCDGLVNAYPAFYNNEKGKEYAEIFTKGMQELRESGELTDILASYGLDDWQN